MTTSLPKQTMRIAEMVIGIMALVVVSPLMAVIAMAIKLESDGPVFDTQRAVTAGGRQCSRLRFRTAAADVPRRSPARTRTTIGNFLWETRLESLPMVINMLRGDFSLDTPALNAR